MVPQDQRVLRVLSRTEGLAGARKLCARTSLQDDVAMDEAVVVAESFGTITGAPHLRRHCPCEGRRTAAGSWVRTQSAETGAGRPNHTGTATCGLAQT